MTFLASHQQPLSGNEMKSYDELKAEMEAIQQQMVEAKKNERANALKEVKRLVQRVWLYCWDAERFVAEGWKNNEKASGNNCRLNKRIKTVG